MKKLSVFKCSAICACLALISFTACKKGDTGPAGKNGVANIQSSTSTTSNSSWKFDARDSSYNTTFNVPAITQAVVDGGTVQMFIGDGTLSDWTAMPWSYGYVQYNFDYEVGKVNIYVTLVDGYAPNNPGGVPFKVVVIPPVSKSAVADSTSHEKKEFIFTTH